MALLLAEIQHERHGRLSRKYWRRFDSISSEIQKKATLLTRPEMGSGHATTALEGQAQDLSEVPDWLGSIFAMHRKYGVMYRYFCAFKGNVNLLLDLIRKMDEQTANTDLNADTVDKDSSSNSSNQGRNRIRNDALPLAPAAILPFGNAIAQRTQQIATGYQDLEQQALILKEGASLLSTTVSSFLLNTLRMSIFR